MLALRSVGIGVTMLTAELSTKNRHVDNVQSQATGQDFYGDPTLHSSLVITNLISATDNRYSGINTFIRFCC